jgi:NitT/TauT family transport system permease protein
MNGIKSFAIILVVWQLISMSIGNSYILPGIDRLILEYPKLFADPRFIDSLTDTLFFLLKSWILILIILFFVLVISVLNKQFRSVFRSLCASLQPTPTFAWLPVFLLVFGVNELTMIFLLIFSTVWMVGLNMIAVLEHSISQWSKHCVNLKLSVLDSVTKVYLPSLKPLLIANIKTCWNLSWRILIGIEVVFGTIGQHWGIGTYMTDAKDVMETSTMYAVFFIIISIGIIVNELFDKTLKEEK